MTRRVTVRDVAKLSGVSQATVSYVINDAPGQTIPQATRDRVFAAVKELGYVPSRAARALRSGRSDLVLILIPDVAMGEMYAQLIDGISNALDPRGYTTICRRKREGISLVRMVGSLDPAAVVALAPLEEAEAAPLEALGVQLVQTHPSLDHPESFAGFQKAVARIQLEHLVERGHTRIGYALPTDPRLELFSVPRGEGVAEFCTEHDLPEPVVISHDLSAEAAATAVEQCREAGVSAVATYNDEYAFAILAGMRALGLSAPEDLAVIGVDDVQLSKFAAPPLTTVTLSPPDAVEVLGKLVLANLGEEEPPELAPQATLPKLVVRETT